MEQKAKTCLNCSDRTIGCHSLCPHYKARSAQNEARKAAFKEQYALDAIVYEVNRDSTKRRKRRKNIR